MSQPAPASSRAMARPSLLAAPVTRTILPVIFPSWGSVIADIALHLAPEYPIRPPRIDNDDGKQEQRAQPQEYLGAGVRGRLIQAEMMGHDHGEQADGDTQIGKREKKDRVKK